MQRLTGNKLINMSRPVINCICANPYLYSCKTQHLDMETSLEMEGKKKKKRIKKNHCHDNRKEQEESAEQLAG